MNEIQNIIDISEAEFNDKVVEASVSKLVVVDFWAPWCGPCKQLTPIVEKISEEMTNVDFVSLDIEEAINTATEFSIRSVPQMYILKNGKVVSQKVGASDYNTVSAWIKENV